MRHTPRRRTTAQGLASALRTRQSWLHCWKTTGCRRTRILSMFSKFSTPVAENERSGWCRAAGSSETAMNGGLKGWEGTLKRLKRRSVTETVLSPMWILIGCARMLDNSLPRGFEHLRDFPFNHVFTLYRTSFFISICYVFYVNYSRTCIKHEKTRPLNYCSRDNES